ncbi:hypothetical protein [Paenibacillus xylanexedens]|uniref:hypothetical protein n=1 Tax=Paenibacillus xylanexedens TaxID=528191 RepID=UPI0011A1CB5E|nr:hypothetical protein [Paenibacillus xylanexedens]
MSVYQGMGLGDIPQGNSVSKLKIEANKAVTIRIATPSDSIPSVYEHTLKVGGKWKTFRCLGKDICPLCKAGEKGRFQAYLAVIDRTDDKVKYWKVSRTVALQLLALQDEYGDLTARDFKIMRQGEKLQTTYQFFPKDKEEVDFSNYELPNLEELVPEPMEPEEMKAILRGGVAADREDEEQTSYTPNDKDTPPPGDDNYPF